MGERKVLNKRIPPDFNPSRLPQLKQTKNRKINVRNMLPMTIRCKACENYIYRGTKVNMQSEVVIGETYFGIQIFRFYFKCPNCRAELTMKTDLQNSDYAVEYGASCNYEHWHAKDEEADKDKRKWDNDEIGVAMKILENRTRDSKKEMDILANLYEMKSIKFRHAGVSSEELLEDLLGTAEEEEEKLKAEDNALINAIFQGRRSFIRRIEDDDIDEEEQLHIHNGETNNHQAKTRKVSTDLKKQTDFLTRKSIFNSSNKASDTAQASNKPKNPKKIDTFGQKNRNRRKKPMPMMQVQHSKL